MMRINKTLMIVALIATAGMYAADLVQTPTEADMLYHTAMNRLINSNGEDYRVVIDSLPTKLRHEVAKDFQAWWLSQARQENAVERGTARSLTQRFNQEADQQ